MSGDGGDVHCRLARPWEQRWLACKRVHCPACLVPSDIQARHAGRRSSVMPRTPRSKSAWCSECIRYLVGASLPVPVHVARFDPDGVVAERSVEAAHRVLVGVGAQNLLGEPAAPRTGTGSLGAFSFPARSRAATSRSTAAQINSARTGVKCWSRRSRAAAARVPGSAKSRSTGA